MVCFAYYGTGTRRRWQRETGDWMTRQGTHMLAGTRGKILARLCEANATAVDLAQQFGISANAIRLHLRALEEHGLVGYRVVRRGVGKPTHLYELSADAGRLMS